MRNLIFSSFLRHCLCWLHWDWYFEVIALTYIHWIFSIKFLGKLLYVCSGTFPILAVYKFCCRLIHNDLQMYANVLLYPIESLRFSRYLAGSCTFRRVRVDEGFKPAAIHSFSILFSPYLCYEIAHDHITLLRRMRVQRKR